MSKDFAMLAINRHRMQTDGQGITTLVALAGCPLSCPYCINRDLLKNTNLLEYISPTDLVQRLAIDHCYFLYTGGGVTFGGGEPLLQAETISEFARVCPPEWNITIETSLNIPFQKLEPLLNERFSFIIDIKSMQPDIYKKYTGLDNVQVIDNLTKLSDKLPEEKYMIKVPLIPDYSDEESVKGSVTFLKELGISENNIKVFEYIKQ